MDDDSGDDFLTTNDVSGSGASAEERYEKSVRESLSDLSVSGDERTHLTDLRIELNLDKECAKEIFQRVLKERQAEASRAPNPKGAPKTPAPPSTGAASAIHAFIRSRLVELQSRPSGAFVIFEDEATQGFVQFAGSSEEPTIGFDMPLDLGDLAITPDDISTAKQIVMEFGGEEREFNGVTTLGAECGDPEQAAKLATAMLCRVFAVEGTESLSVQTERD